MNYAQKIPRRVKAKKAPARKAKKQPSKVVMRRRTVRLAPKRTPVSPEAFLQSYEQQTLPLWQYFIDPADWHEASQSYPSAPWRLYLRPTGTEPAHAWENFQRAVAHTRRLAVTRRSKRSETLTLKDILEINALVMSGDTSQWQSALRDDRPIFNTNSADKLRRVFKRNSTQYENDDRLSLRVEGFWPTNKMSVDFFIACRQLTRCAEDKKRSGWKSALEAFRGHLLEEIPSEAVTVQVYFLSSRKELERQLDQLLKWYNKQAAAILKLKSADQSRQRVLELAVKMQRYLDIQQFCSDGSGRTSKLIQEYIFLRFGHFPPRPIPYQAFGQHWENGTYLPLELALEMARIGWNVPPKK